MFKLVQHKFVYFGFTNKSFFSGFKLFLVLSSLFFSFQYSFAQLTLTQGLTPMQLAQTIVGAGYTVSNAKLVAPNGSIGTFVNAGSNIGITDGILLTTGSINVANGPNSLMSAGVNSGASGDSDLSTLSGAVTFDGCALEFDLIPACDSLVINYVFASEEYPEYVNKQFNDVFAFFVSGPGIVGTQNIALVPSTALPVSINNINAGNNAQYFVDNTGGATIQYDGFTVPLYARAQVIPCQTYHLKIVIADVVDGIFDSGVFIKGNTIECAPVAYNDVASNINAITTCTNGSFTFCRTGPQNNPFTVNYTIAGTAVNGVNYQQIPNSIVIPAGQQCATVTIVPIVQVGGPPVTTVQIIYPFGFCPKNDTLTLTISNPPPINAGPDVEICSGDSIQIGVLAFPGNTYSWQPTTGLSNPNISNPKVSLTNTGNTDQIVQYVLSVTNPQIGTCVLKDSLLVKVKPLPKALFNVAPDHCIGGSVQFNDNSVPPTGKTINSWYWTFGNSLFNNTQNPAITYTTTGTFTVTLTVTDNTGCKHDTTQTINVWPSPLPSFTSNTPCEGDSVVFTNTSTVPGGGTISQSIWSFGDGSALLSAFAPSHLYPTTTNTYTVQLIITSDKNCVSTIQQSIIIRPKPTVSFTAPAVCLGAPTKFFNTSTGLTDFWDFGDGNTSTVRNPSHTYAAPGTYNVKLVSTTSFGCKDSITRAVVVYNIPIFDFTVTDTAGCPEFCTNFNAITLPGSDPVTSWTWTFQTGTSDTGTTATYCYSSSGNFSPSLVATTANGCKDTVDKPFYIHVYPLPTAFFNVTPNPLSSWDPVATFTDNSSTDAVTWSWDFGDNTSSNVQNPPAHTYALTKDEYLVYLIVTNNYGCIDTTFKYIKINEESTLYVPNAFTPNADGFNEQFRPYCTGIYARAKYEMTIFDRWGMLIYRTDELNEGWNGTLNERVCQQDVYVYVIKFWDKNDGTLLKKLKGTATLIR